VKILLSGAFNPAFEALPEYLASALVRLGHEVHLFNHRAFLLPGRVRALSPPLERLDRARLNARLVRLTRRLRPDQVLVNQGMVLTPDTVRALRDLGARCVNWFSDYPAEFDLGLRAAPAYDAFYLGSSYAAARHEEAGNARSAWLPFACDPYAHRPPDTSAAPEGASGSAERIVFVGSHYPERQILLRFLHGLPVGIWGPGWERASGDPHLLPMLRESRALRPAAWRALYARAEVVVNIHYGSLGPREVSGDLANTRVFEILGCGAHQVVNRQGDVLRLFREGEHLSAFSSGDELRAVVEGCLRDADRRRAVAANGRRAVLAAHTYDHRARLLLDRTIAGLDGAHRPAPDAPARLAAAAGGGR